VKGPKIIGAVQIRDPRDEKRGFAAWLAENLQVFRAREPIFRPSRGREGLAFTLSENRVRSAGRPPERQAFPQVRRQSRASRRLITT
jgi:hypothetical protein